MTTTRPLTLVVAINPAARFGANRHVGDGVVAALRARGHAVVALSAPDFAQLRAAAEAALENSPDALVVVGGDGMVSLGVNLVAETDIPLGIIPTGTGNDTALGLGIPVGDYPAAIAALIAALDGSPRAIDAARVTHGESAEGATTTWFACVLSAGFDALCNERANRMRWPAGKSRYTLALLLELVRLKPIRYHLDLDGVVRDFEGTLVAVGNNSSFGGGMLITPAASLDDGLLDVITLERVGRLALLRLFPKIFSGAHVHDPRVRQRQAKRVVIGATGVVAYADGERLGPLPVTIDVVPGALRVLAPVPSRSRE